MYRENELRLTNTTAKIPELTNKKIARLSNEQRIDIASRIEILQTLAGYKWVGEAAHAISLTKPSTPTTEQEIAISLLDDMELAYSFDWVKRSEKYYSWVQFAINKPMLNIFMDKTNPFSIIENGAVYGYPVSATLAYAGIIPDKKVKQKDIANRYLNGVNSQKYYEREIEYTQNVWDRLSELAPKLITEAEEEYRRLFARSGEETTG